MTASQAAGHRAVLGCAHRDPRAGGRRAATAEPRVRVLAAERWTCGAGGPDAFAASRSTGGCGGRGSFILRAA